MRNMQAIKTKIRAWTEVWRAENQRSRNVLIILFHPVRFLIVLICEVYKSEKNAEVYDFK